MSQLLLPCITSKQRQLVSDSSDPMLLSRHVPEVTMTCRLWLVYAVLQIVAKCLSGTSLCQLKFFISYQLTSTSSFHFHLMLHCSDYVTIYWYFKLIMYVRSLTNWIVFAENVFILVFLIYFLPASSSTLYAAVFTLRLRIGCTLLYWSRTFLYYDTFT